MIGFRYGFHLGCGLEAGWPNFQATAWEENLCKNEKNTMFFWNFFGISGQNTVFLVILGENSKKIPKKHRVFSCFVGKMIKIRIQGSTTTKAKFGQNEGV